MKYNEFSLECSPVDFSDGARERNNLQRRTITERDKHVEEKIGARRLLLYLYV